MSKIEVDAIDKQSGSTLTLGGSGTAVTLACGATQSGFGRTGTVDWQTAIKTATFTAASGEGYFCNTTGGIFTVNLPSSPSVGDIVAIKDYAGTFNTNNLTIGRGGSNMNGAASDSVRNTNNESLTLVYADATKGWLAVEEGTGFVGETFMIATGGTITTSGNDKIHTFTGPGTFTVCSVSSCATKNLVSYLVVAGGGAGGSEGVQAGGGGAGGYREVKNPVTPYTASPLDGYGTPANRVTVTATAFPIVVGGGGASSGSPSLGGSGGVSTFSSITSAGGGGGGGRNPAPAVINGTAGGSGGGTGNKCGPTAGGAGNTPPVSPAQGFPGGASGPDSSSVDFLAGGGGGATAAGEGSSVPTNAADGGAGATTSISASPVAYAGGGGSTKYSPSPPSTTGGCGGTGGGGNGILYSVASRTNMDGETNKGGGGGGGEDTPAPLQGGNGGSGIVIIRYKFQ
jgi:hypothetical protein